jgi:hypothetical protein
MPDASSRPQGSDADSTRHPVWDRVLTRVRHAELAADRGASSRVMRHRRLDAAAQGGPSPEQRREVRALRRVFLDLGDSYREYRRRTGAEVSPEVRDAANRFRRELDLASLVSVAASLDRIELLTW